MFVLSCSWSALCLKGSYFCCWCSVFGCLTFAVSGFDAYPWFCHFQVGCRCLCCESVLWSSEDGEESAGEDGALPSRRLVTSGKRFHDLDGVERVCQLKLKMDVVYEFQVLYRVLKEERIDALLEDYRFSVDRWRSLAVVHLSCPPPPGSVLDSFSCIHGTTNLPVWLDKRLFVLFIKCLWSPYDWSGLSLDKSFVGVPL
jgi:hypothetical protein